MLLLAAPANSAAMVVREFVWKHVSWSEVAEFRIRDNARKSRRLVAPELPCHERPLR